jgi:hypothetical protein
VTRSRSSASATGQSRTTSAKHAVTTTKCSRPPTRARSHGQPVTLTPNSKRQTSADYQTAPAEDSAAAPHLPGRVGLAGFVLTGRGLLTRPPLGISFPLIQRLTLIQPLTHIQQHLHLPQAQLASRRTSQMLTNLRLHPASPFLAVRVTRRPTPLSRKRRLRKPIGILNTAHRTPAVTRRSQDDIRVSGSRNCGSGFAFSYAATASLAAAWPISVAGPLL